MFLMPKTLLRVGAIAAVGLLALADTPLDSYFGTAARLVGDAVRDEVPIDFELHRAEDLVAKIDPQVTACKRDLARCEIRLEDLDAEIVDLRSRKASRERSLRESTASLAGGAEACALPVSLSDDPTESRAALALRHALSQVERDRAMLASKEKLRDQQASAVSAARARVEAVLAERARLADTFEMLRVRAMYLEAAEATNPAAGLDETPLKEAQSLLAELEQRIRVRQRLLDDEPGMASVVADPAEDVATVLADVQAYFASAASPAER